MISLLDYLTTLSKNSWYGAFDDTFIFTFLSAAMSYSVFLMMCSYSLADDGGIDDEELMKRVQSTLSDEDIIVPVKYREVHHYFFWPAMMFFLVWFKMSHRIAYTTKPGTIYQGEYIRTETLYFGPQALFFIYLFAFCTVGLYHYGEQDIYHWDPKKQWKKLYFYATDQFTLDWIFFFLIIFYPLYLLTYPVVEHTHTAYIFYSLIIFWMPFCTYFTYLTDNCEIVNADIQPGGMISDWVEVFRVKKQHNAWTKEYLTRGMILKEGYNFSEYVTKLNIDDISPIYDEADLFTWRRYIILLVVTLPVAFLFLFFV